MKFPKSILIVVLMMFSLSKLNAQVNLDSLWSIWNDEDKSDTIRLKAIDEFVWSGYVINQKDSAFYYAKLQYDFASKIGEKKFMALALNSQAYSFKFQNNYNSALDFYLKALVLRKELKDE